MYLQSHIYKKYSSKFWFYNCLKSRSVFVFTLYFGELNVSNMYGNSDLIWFFKGTNVSTMPYGAIINCIASHDIART